MGLGLIEVSSFGNRGILGEPVFFFCCGCFFVTGGGPVSE